jgi:hypothetical protein
MFKWYYLLWADAIYVGKTGGYRENWRFKAGFLMSIFMFINIKTFLILFDLEIMWLDIPGWAKNRSLQSPLNLINWFLPFAIINFYFIFYKDKWMEIEKKYPHSNKKLFLTYFAVSMILGFGALVYFKLLGYGR